MTSLKPNHLSVCLSPLEYKAYHRDGNVVVLIDVIRATTVICTALNRGAECVMPLADIDKTLAMRAQGYLVAGERNSFKLEAFDLGNSPIEYTSPSIKGKRIAITTTNGTQALAQIPENTSVVAGAWVNQQVLLEHLLSINTDVMLLCSGWENTVSIEDSLFAGQVAEKLLSSGKFFSNTDSVFIATQLSIDAANNELDFILEHSPRLKSKFERLKNDIEFCITHNSQPVVPILMEGRFVAKK